MATSTTDPQGYGLLAAFCTAVLPFPDGSGGVYMRAITTVQPTLGLGTDPRTGALLPDIASGRQLLVGALLCRISTARGSLVDTQIPTTTAQYGIDISDSADADMSPQDAGQLSAGIDSQISADERVKSSLTAGALVGDTLVLPITVTDRAGPFKLTLAISTLTADLSVLSSPT